MTTKEIIDKHSNEKLNDDGSAPMAGGSSSNAFTIETECGLSTSSISASDHTEYTTPGAKRSESELSQMISNMILEKWDSLFPPTPKITIESILSEDSDESSAGEGEKDVTHHKSSSHVEDGEVQNHTSRNTARTHSKKKKPKKPARRQPYYHCAMPDTRNLSGGVTTILAAAMEGEYNELWKEIQNLILCESIRLRL